MRFVLDYDVDVRVCQLFTASGHECWRAPDGLIEDDDISVYADDRNAVVLSHDREFAYADKDGPSVSTFVSPANSQKRSMCSRSTSMN